MTFGGREELNSEGHLNGEPQELGRIFVLYEMDVLVAVDEREDRDEESK